jgi:predicted ferric reductase
LWFAAERAGQSAVPYLGQFFGAESVPLLSIGLVLISTLPWCEAAFDGIDRTAIWHRRVAITGVILLVPHIVLSANPHHSKVGPALGDIGEDCLLIQATWAILPRWRSVIPRLLQWPVLLVRGLPGLRHLHRAMGGYEVWRSIHRLTGLFVAAGFAHGLLDGTPFPHAQVLRWTFVAIGGTGLAFYLYRELLAKYFVPLYDYQFAQVHQAGAGITEIAMAPLGRPATFAPGQFARST